MTRQTSFKGCAIVACGTISVELNHMRDTGMLDAEKILYTKPGLHERIQELESQLTMRIDEAKKYASKIIIVYGGKFCYINIDDPYRNIDVIINGQIIPGVKIKRINATHCVNMLASSKELEEISQGKNVY